MLSRLLCLCALVFLTACGADHKWASDAEVARATYVAGPPASVTLFTVINNRSGEGAHSGLLINGSQRVIYDPAGSWELNDGLAPEREDLHYGMTDPVLTSYVNYHARDVFRVVQQTVLVPQDVADQIIAHAVAYGSASKAACAHSISTILRQSPGFEGLASTFFPKALSRSFATLPGVTEKIITGTDSGHNYIAIDAAVAAETN